LFCACAKRDFRGLEMRQSCLDPGSQEIIESAYDYQVPFCLNLVKNKPQIKIVEGSISGEKNAEGSKT